MKFKMLLLLCLCNGYVSAQDNDPFNKSQRKASSPHNSVNEEPRYPRCQTQQHVIAAEIPFERLKIIGILQYQEQARVLFHDEKQIFSAVVGDFIAQEQFKIHQINKHNVQLNKFRQDCSAAEIVSIKF